VDRTTILWVGLAFLILADLVLAGASSVAGVAVGIVLWGLHMGFTQGLFSTLVADAAPAEMRGTAFGMFNLVTGLALLAASVIAGALWQAAGPAWTFLAGAGFAALTMLGLVRMRRHVARAGKRN
jgi:MFS family permease